MARPRLISGSLELYLRRLGDRCCVGNLEEFTLFEAEATNEQHLRKLLDLGV
jgi:hypothetical protein